LARLFVAQDAFAHIGSERSRSLAEVVAAGGAKSRGL